MTIRFICNCGKRLEVSDSLGGQSLRCPNCAAEIAVPKAVEANDFSKDIGSRPEERLTAEDQNPEKPVAAAAVPPAPRSKPSNKAIVSLTFGLLSFCANFLTAIPALILGLLSLRDISRSQGRLRGKKLAIWGIITGLVGLVFSTAAGIGSLAIVLYWRNSLVENAAKIDCDKDLKEVGQGLILYSDNYGGLPPALVLNTSPRRDPKQMHSGLSWRVAILPFLGEGDLYKEFDLDQPWDSPNNVKLIPRMPRVFAHPLAPDAQNQSGLTHYRVFVGLGTLFDPNLVHGINRGIGAVGARMAADIADGRSNTLMVVEAADPVEWTRPDDLPYVANKPLPRLGGLFSKSFNVVTADGKVHLVRQDAKESALRGIITRNGGETINWNDLE